MGGKGKKNAPYPPAQNGPEVKPDPQGVLLYLRPTAPRSRSRPGSLGG